MILQGITNHAHLQVVMLNKLVDRFPMPWLSGGVDSPVVGSNICCMLEISCC